MMVSQIHSSKDDFKFSAKQLLEIEELKPKYKDKRSLILPVLWMIQRSEGWISKEAIVEASKILDVLPIAFYEVGSFYAMFNFDRKGKYHIKICKTLSCALAGKDNLVDYVKKTYNINLGDTSYDQLISLDEVECLGYCNEAPAVLINEKQYSRVTKDSLKNIIDNLLLEERD